MEETNIQKRVEVIMTEEVYETVCKLIKQQEKNRAIQRRIYHEKKGTKEPTDKKYVKTIKFESVKRLE